MGGRVLWKEYHISIYIGTLCYMDMDNCSYIYTPVFFPFVRDMYVGGYRV